MATKTKAELIDEILKCDAIFTKADGSVLFKQIGHPGSTRYLMPVITAIKIQDVEVYPIKQEHRIEFILTSFKNGISYWCEV